MPVVKVVELLGESETSWEHAIQEAVSTASETIRNISGIEVLNMTASIENGKISKYKANMNVAFSVDDT
ncbi:MAG: dodecin domain-containing protein [Firmicutes bacterium]|nr:dodecin domain-containing protein [Bacillota bacterium]